MNITGISLWGDSIGKGVMYDAQRGRYAIYGDNLFSLLKKSLDIPVDNYAVMGCTAPVGEERMRRAELREGSLAVIEFGGNDCDMPWADISAAPEGEYLPKTPLDKFCDSVRGMIYRAREQGATPVRVTPPPLDAGRYFNWVSRKLNADNILDYLGDVQYIYRWQEHYASAVRRIASETGCALCDIRDQFLALRRIDRLLCVDGIHPNQQGYSIISNYATKRLNEVYDVVI